MTDDTEQATPLRSFNWYVGSMNDAVFIIDRPPYPAPDDTGPYFSESGPRPVSKAIDETNAEIIVKAHNAVVMELRELIVALRAEIKEIAADRASMEALWGPP